MKKQKLVLTKHTIRQLTDLSLNNVRGGFMMEDARSENGTCHCASKKASGCPCPAA